MKIVRILALFVLAVFLSVSCWAADTVKNINTKDASALLKNPPRNMLIVDVRTPEEFRTGHLANARNMDFFGNKFDMDIKDLPKDQPILVYCRSGRRSAAAVEELAKTGHTNIFHMEEGLDGWQNAKLPVEK